MKTINIISNICLMAAIIFVIGCAPTIPPPGTVDPKPVETSGDKNKWVTDDKDFWVDEEKIGREKSPVFVFRFILRDEADLQSAIDGLDGEAYTALINLIKVRAGMEYDDAIKGSPAKKETIGKVRQRVVNAIGDATFAGVAKRNSYWEKYMRHEAGNRVAYFYNILALYRIPEEEYQMAKERAWNETQKGLSGVDKDAEQLMQEAKDRFLKRQ